MVLLPDLYLTACPEYRDSSSFFGRPSPLVFNIVLVVLNKVNAIDLALGVNGVITLKLASNAFFDHSLEVVDPLLVVVVQAVLGVPLWDLVEF